MVQEIFRFLKNPRKPAILAMSRPDAKKNITTLVKAFGEDPTLRELANLVLIMVSLSHTGLSCRYEALCDHTSMEASSHGVVHRTLK